jgi:hypothetical protein
MGAILAHHGLLLADAGGGGATDPFYSSVSLLLHGEGSNHSNTFTDNSPSPKTPTVSGSGVAEISTTNFKYGAASIGLGTAGTPAALDYASNAVFGFGSGDYTLEAFVRSLNTASNINVIFDTRNASTTGVCFWMGGGVASQPGNVLGVSSNSAVLATGGTVSANTWFHCALTRSGTTLRGFVDGVQVFSLTDSRTYATSAPCRLGVDYAASTGQALQGWLDEVRITKGVARYTANFTPPSSAFPNS